MITDTLKINVLARDYAIKCHSDTNHLYNGLPYRTHLDTVVNVAELFIHLIPEKDRRTVQAACWVHDCIEDCRQTYNDVKNATNQQVAEIAYALTNEKGKNRKERANEKYYQGIRETKYAVFVKACDRIANTRYSRDHGRAMFEMYQKESPTFISSIYHEDYDELFNYLLKITKD